MRLLVAGPGSPITLAGPLAVYAFAASLCVLGLLLGASVGGPGTTVVNFVDPSPAAAAGLELGDQIVAIAGVPISDPAEMRGALASQPEGAVEVRAERRGQVLRFLVDLKSDRRLRVQLGPNQSRLAGARAIRSGVAKPYQVLAGTFAALGSDVKIDVAGPVAVVNVTALKPTFADRLLTAGVVESYAVLVFLLGSLALWPPRVRGASAPAGDGASVRKTSGADALAGPWARFFARALDWTLISLVVSSFAPPATLLASFIWLPIEALLLSRWGFTPGKWLLGVVVRDVDGGRPPFRTAFHRVAALWAYGTGADSLFGLATGILAFGTLKRRGATYWDELTGYRVGRLKVGAVRTGLAVVVIILAAAGVAMLGARTP